MFLFVKVFRKTSLCEKNESKSFLKSTYSKRDMMRLQGKSETSLQGLLFIKFLWATLCPVAPSTGDCFLSGC